MNAKIAKKLRKIALGMVVAAEQNGKKIEKVVYLQDGKTGQIRVSQQSWKGAYKALKKGLKKQHTATVSAWNSKLSTIAQRQAAVSSVA